MDNMLKLQCHPETQTDSIDLIEVAVSLGRNGTLCLQYLIKGDLENIELPKQQNPMRTDYLWQNTCFEIFITRQNIANYIEYNFCPSSRWAAYQFSNYRNEGQNLPVDKNPKIHIENSKGNFALKCETQLPAEWWGGELFLGISAIIEEKSGAKSFWALAHGPGTPDFHNRDCFIHRLKAADSHEKRN